MASRGRKAPSKGGKGNSASRKAPPAGAEDTETKTSATGVNGIGPNVKHETPKIGSDVAGDTGMNGFITPPPGSCTPLAPNGGLSGPNAGSQADASEMETSVMGTMPLGQSERCRL